MKIVVWGIGQRAKQIILEIGIEVIDFFIDSNRKKQEFLKKPVLFPKEVKDWHELFIYIPSTYYDEVLPILKEHDLVEKINYKQHFGVAKISYVEAERNLHMAINRIVSLKKKSKRNICNWGSFWSVDVWGGFYYNLIQRYQKDMVVVCENPFALPDEISDILKIDALIVPLAGYGRINVEEIQTMELNKMKESIRFEVGEAINDLAESIYLRQSSIKREAAFYNACVLHRYIKAFLDAYKWRIIIINGSDAPERLYLAKLCKIKNIPYICTHPSVLPGTVSFDPGGDVGTSMPAVYYKGFSSLPVSEEEKESALRICRYLYGKRLNRKEQPHNDAVLKIKKSLPPGHPTILCVAQCDDGACLIPYTKNSRKYHSPMFSSSIESAVFLADICKKNNWTLIYKSHPLYAKFDRIDLLPDNVIYVDACDINDLIDMSDVIVTIRSTTNYVALIREKPVLMLGYTQTRGQGCTYEAFERDDIEPQLKKAIAEGFTKKQKEAFIEHVARLLKYYLYDDMLPRELRYGLPMPEKLEDFYLLGRELQELDSKLKDEIENG